MCGVCTTQIQFPEKRTSAASVTAAATGLSALPGQLATTARTTRAMVVTNPGAVRAGLAELTDVVVAVVLLLPSGLLAAMETSTLQALCAP